MSFKEPRRTFESPASIKDASPRNFSRCSVCISMMFLPAVVIVLLAIAYEGCLLVRSTSLSTSFGSYLSPEDGKAPYIVDTGYAKYLGNQTYSNAVAYLGIPYAEPPLANRRYRKPLPLDRERVHNESLSGGADGVVDARSYPEFCIQGTTNHGDAGGAGSEDCLKVNIYAPSDANKESTYPVLVYIHGGGYMYGNPRNWPFDHWIQQSPSVVIVSVYYRLSSFGFLASSAFVDNPSLGDLNPGFLDQIEALKWIKENIAAFGGDPQRVTINGESAGGSSVELHLVANGGKSELFNGAIAQSVYRTPVPEPAQQDDLFSLYADLADCSSSDIESTMVCLRQADVSSLARAQDQAMLTLATSGYRIFHPVLDGQIISDYPTRLIQKGLFAKVPLIVGATANESLSSGGDLQSSLKVYFPSIQDEDIQALLNAYPESDFATSGERFDTLTGDSELRCARSIMAAAFSNYSEVWAYRYNQPTPGASKVNHAAENWMMFEGTSTGSNGTTSFQPQSAANKAFSKELISYWLSFVRSGNPNTYKLERSPVWEGYQPQKQRIVLQQPVGDLDGVSGSIMEQEDLDLERCSLVATQSGTQQN